MSEQQLEPGQNGMTALEIVSAVAVFAVMVATGALMSGFPMYILGHIA